MQNGMRVRIICLFPLWADQMFLLPICHSRTYLPIPPRNREEHIQRKIDLMVTEAKTKMAKKDKKGEW